MELLLLLVAIIDMPLEMRLCAEALPTIWILALVILAVVPLMMSIETLAADLRRWERTHT